MPKRGCDESVKNESHRSEGNVQTRAMDEDKGLLIIPARTLESGTSDLRYSGMTCASLRN
jgi:hypothetical protein